MYDALHLSYYRMVRVRVVVWLARNVSRLTLKRGNVETRGARASGSPGYQYR